MKQLRLKKQQQGKGSSQKGITRRLTLFDFKMEVYVFKSICVYMFLLAYEWQSPRIPFGFIILCSLLLL